MFNSYLLLTLAIIFEVAGTMLLPLSPNFTKIYTYFWIDYSLFRFFLLSDLLFENNTHFNCICYLEWNGHFPYQAILGYFIYRQTINWQVAIGLILIITGVILVNIYSYPNSKNFL